MRKKLIAFLVMFALIMGTVPVMAANNETTDADIIADVFLVRPISLASIVLGSAIFVAALPFSIPTRSVGKVGQVIVVEPCKFTFVRPVGDFN
jgi:hypothetical protein